MIPYNEENKAKIVQVAEKLQGTCNQSLDEVLQEVFRDDRLDMMQVDTELLHELDDITQECQCCGWWVETSELDDEGICTDCREN